MCIFGRPIVVTVVVCNLKWTAAHVTAAAAVTTIAPDTYVATHQPPTCKVAYMTLECHPRFYSNCN